MTENDIIINNEIFCVSEFRSTVERFVIKDFNSNYQNIALDREGKNYKYCIITYSEFFSNFESQEERRIRIAKGFVR